MHVLFRAVAALLLSTGAVFAAPTTIVGSYTLGYTPIAGNAPKLTDSLSSPFTESLNLNTPTAITNFFAVTPAGSCGITCNHNVAKGTISVNFTFSSPTIGSASQTATYLANYSNDTDSVTWASSQPLVVNFTNGAVLDIDLINAEDWTIYPKIQFDLIKGPNTVPEPASVALLASGLLGLGFVAMRRRKKSLSA